MSLPWIKTVVNNRRVTISLPDEGANRNLELTEKIVALISIFGDPRSAKSFLLNCIRGMSVFQTLSGDADPCTQGVDLSRPVPLSEYAGHLLQQLDLDSLIAFADVEGGGDRDADDYDMRLYSALLLVSTVMIYNWKGGLKKRGKHTHTHPHPYIYCSMQFVQYTCR
jgi:hypothetical protein